MTAIRALAGAYRNAGTSALDLPVAAFAALAVAFVAFAAPADLLADLIAATGLPTVLPAAAPPLGASARIAVGVIGSSLAFGFAFLALRGLDRLTARPAMRAAPVLAPDQSPRLRRRDLHPDAPAVRPISAARDFGDPEIDIPSWLAEAVEAPARPPEPQAVSVPASAPADDASLAALMARLETGLAKGPLAARRVPPPRRDGASQAPSDDRLQNAIESLQRLTARQG